MGSLMLNGMRLSLVVGSYYVFGWFCELDSVVASPAWPLALLQVSEFVLFAQLLEVLRARGILKLAFQPAKAKKSPALTWPWCAKAKCPAAAANTQAQSQLQSQQQDRQRINWYFVFANMALQCAVAPLAVALSDRDRRGGSDVHEEHQQQQHHDQQHDYARSFTLLAFFWQFAILNVGYEVFFYLFHRLAHESRWVFTNIHAYHHRHTAPEAMAAIDAHPLEHIFVNQAPFFITACLCAPHLVTVYTFVILGMISTMSAHAGFAELASARHDDHHRWVRGNYGMYFMDKLCGTEYVPTALEQTTTATLTLRQ